MNVKVGDYLFVCGSSFTRRNKAGRVVEIFDDGVALDFFCGWDGKPETLPSIEFWAWNEIEPAGAEEKTRGHDG